MNDDLQTYIEPELEARLVALVLGEASAFEAGELERLMTERVELRACMKRLEEVHGVMVSAHETGDDDGWKLSEARRGKIFAKVEAARLEREREEAQRQSRASARALRRRKLVMACAACVVMGMMVTVLMELGDMKESRSVDLLGGSSHVMEPRSPEEALAVLDKEISAQSDLVQDARKELTVLIQEYGIPYFEDGHSNPLGMTEQDMLRGARGRLDELEVKQDEIESKIKGMVKSGVSGEVKAAEVAKLERGNQEVDRLRKLVRNKTDATVDLSLRSSQYNQAREAYEQSREMLLEMEGQKLEVQKALQAKVSEENERLSGETGVVPEGVVVFDWKTSSEEGKDRLWFKLDKGRGTRAASPTTLDEFIYEGEGRSQASQKARVAAALADLDKAVPGSLSLQGVENSERTGPLPAKFFRADDARSRNSIKPKSRVAIPGIPNSPRGDVNGVVTGGNRSGVAAIDRAVVDGLLNGRLGGESVSEKKSELADALAELDEAVPDVSVGVVDDGVSSLYALALEDGNEADPLPTVNTAGVNLGFDDNPEPFEGVAKEQVKRGRALSESDAIAEKPRQVRVTTKDVEREDGRLGWSGKDKDSRWSERNEKVPEPASEPAAKMPPTMKRVSKAEVASKPSAPMPRVVATNTNSPGAIPVPVPEIEVAEALTDFGNGDDFGDGFGNGRGSGGDKEEARPKGGDASRAYYPGNHKTNAGVVDSRRSVKLDPTSGKGMQRMREKQEAEGKVPELGDLPVLGRLVDEQGDLEEDPSGGEGQVRGVAYRGKKKGKGQDLIGKKLSEYLSDHIVSGNEGGNLDSELRALKVSGNRETTNRVIRRETPDAPAWDFELADQSIENGQPLGDDDSSLYGQDYVDAKILEGEKLAVIIPGLTAAKRKSVLENVRVGGLKKNLSGFQHSTEVNRGLELDELDQLEGDLLPADEEIVWYRIHKAGDVEKKGEELGGDGGGDPFAEVDGVSDADEFFKSEGAAGNLSVSNKLKQVIIPEVDFKDTTVEDAIKFIELRTRELDNTTLDDSKRGVEMEIRKPRVEGGLDGGDFLDPSQTKINELKLRNVPADVALNYIAEAAKMRYKVDESGKVTFVPLTASDSADVLQQKWKVSPEFLSFISTSSSDQDAVDDPFGSGDENQSTGIVARQSVKDLLKANGVEFPPGASVSFLKDDGSLIVRSTPTQLKLVGGIVDAFEKDLKKTEAAQKEAETRRMERENFETSTTQKSDSTFSLNVSDVSFKLAKSSLASGKRPEVAKVRAEEFVNAFDYGDTKPTQAEKVSCVFEQGSHPFMSQRNLMRISMSTASLGRNAGTPLRLTLLLDQSGSMERLDRVESLKRAFALLAAQLNANDEVTLVGFARTPRLLAERVKGNEVAKLAEIIANPLTEGGTNLEGALSTALQLAKQQYVKGAQNRIILMTDGAANLGDARPETLARQVESMRKAGISFDACGVGADGLNDEVLSSLAKKGDGRYYFLDRPEDADEGFAKQIAGALRPAAKNVKVQVLFNPERVASFKLYGFEKHKLKKEDFRNDAVDAAEMAAEESGMALYHFEPKPEGRGDVGTVSVRFLDAASNEMVERTWVIPYEKEAPFFNEADAKLRLAGVAGLFAERLKGSPVGDRVELKKLRQELQVLRAEFGSQTRFQELQTMLQQAGN